MGGFDPIDAHIDRLLAVDSETDAASRIAAAIRVRRRRRERQMTALAVTGSACTLVLTASVVWLLVGPTHDSGDGQVTPQAAVQGTPTRGSAPAGASQPPPTVETVSPPATGRQPRALMASATLPSFDNAELEPEREPQLAVPGVTVESLQVEGLRVAGITVDRVAAEMTTPPVR